MSMVSSLRQSFMMRYPTPKGGRKKVRWPVDTAGPSESSEPSELTKGLMKGFAEAAKNAIAQHHKLGTPVYVADAEGNLCQLLPDRTLRKLSQAEIDALT